GGRGGGGLALQGHRRVVARAGAAGGRAAPGPGAAPGYVTAEGEGRAVVLAPRLLDRPAHRAAATLFPHDPGLLALTTCHNARKLLDFRDYLGELLSPSLARVLLRAGRATTLAAWIDHLPDAAADRAGGARLAADLRACVGAEPDPGPARTFDRTATRAFEERVWRTIAALAEGDFRQKDNADGIAVNRGKSGGKAARAAHLTVAERRDLERLGDHLHERYRALIAAHGLEARAEVVDQPFLWETDFAFPWSDGWAKNQSGDAQERNVVLMIPGRNRGEAVIMA